MRSPTRTASAKRRSCCKGLTRAERPRRQGRRALRLLAINKVFRLRQHREQARQSRHRRRADREVQPAGHRPPQLEVRGLRAGRKALHPGRRRTATSARSTPASTARSAATIADGTGMEIVARGVRNTVGFDWHPVTGSSGSPTTAATGPATPDRRDELNRVPKDMEGANFGFPYCHANGIADPDVKRRTLRRRDPAGGADRSACGGPRHQVLHRRHVPQAATRTSPSSPATARGIARRSSAMTSRSRAHQRRQGQDRAVPDRAPQRGEERAVRPAVLRVPDEGRLAAGLRRDQRRGLSHQLRQSEDRGQR